MPIHDLKTWTEPFNAILSGAKTHEIRRADRPFAVGDRLLLREWRPRTTPFTCNLCGAVASHLPEFVPLSHANCDGWFTSKPIGYTGREILVEVTHLSDAGSWGLPEGLCVMSIRLLSEGDSARC